MENGMESYQDLKDRAARAEAQRDQYLSALLEIQAKGLPSVVIQAPEGSKLIDSVTEQALAASRKEAARLREAAKPIVGMLEELRGHSSRQMISWGLVKPLVITLHAALAPQDAAQTEGE